MPVALSLSTFATFRWVLLLAALLLASCAQQRLPTGSPTTAEEVPAVVSEQQLERRRQVAELLSRAVRQLRRDRLMVPAGDSAYEYFQQVLRLERENAAAQRGIAAVNARYLQLAEEAFRGGDYARSQRMLTGAGRVATTAAQIDMLRLRYRAPALAANEFLLQLRQLDSRNEALLHYLQELTDKLVAAHSRLLIVARNDAEGRWLYQQMRQMAGGYRLRGNIQVGPRPRIILLDLAAS